jgi:hypothetical protein
MTDKASQSSRPQTRRDEIIFRGDMCLAKNTSRGADCASVVVTWVNVRYPRQREYLNDSPGSSSSKLKQRFNFEKDVLPESESIAASAAMRTIPANKDVRVAERNPAQIEAQRSGFDLKKNTEERYDDQGNDPGALRPQRPQRL